VIFTLLVLNLCPLIREIKGDKTRAPFLAPYNATIETT
jgi:hypothetical protein